MSDRIPFQPDFNAIRPESECRKLLRPMLDAAGIEATYPIETDAVADALIAGNFRVTSDVLIRWAGNGWCESVDEFNGQLLWSPRNVYAAMLLALVYRHYDPLSPRFADDATKYEKQYAKANREGRLPYPSLASVSINELIVQMERQEKKESRELLCAEIRLRLADILDS